MAVNGTSMVSVVVLSNTGSFGQMYILLTVYDQVSKGRRLSCRLLLFFSPFKTWVVVALI